MLLKLLIKILLKKQNQFIRAVKLKDKTYVINVEEYKPINVVIDDYRRTAQEVSVQEQPKFVPSNSEGICTGKLCEGSR